MCRFGFQLFGVKPAEPPELPLPFVSASSQGMCLTSPLTFSHHNSPFSTCRQIPRPQHKLIFEVPFSKGWCLRIQTELLCFGLRIQTELFCVLVFLPDFPKPLLVVPGTLSVLWFSCFVLFCFKGSSATGWAPILQQPLGLFWPLLGFNARTLMQQFGRFQLDSGRWAKL